MELPTITHWVYAPMKTTGQRLRALRTEKGLSLEEAGRLLSLSFNALAMYERDERTPPTDKLQRLADFYGVSVDYLLKRTEEPSPPALRGHEIPLRRVPLIGRVPAGRPIWAEENIEDQIQVPAGMQADFALRVFGDSMEGAGIRSGDIVFCVRATRQQPQPGDMVVALCNGGEVTVKWLLQAEDGTWFLRASNPKYRDIPLRGPEDRVQAVVVGSLRGKPRYPGMEDEPAAGREP